MVTDGQVRRLRKELGAGRPLWLAAEKARMTPKTARKWRDLGQLPSEVERRPRDWQTREDAFAGVWSEVAEQLEVNPGLEAKTLFAWLQRKYPGRFQDGQLRTLQRRVKVWRATEGPAKEVFFAQVHHPGRLGASDFTHMTDLEITIAGQRFEHMLYHFVLTYSNWETVRICYSESFESLSDGLQRALEELGGVPERHRTDRLTAAINNLSDSDLFTQRYQALLEHYKLTAERTQAGKGNENGDVEQLHRRFKQALDQALMLRGSRDFESKASYEHFLRELLGQLNSGRTKRFEEERQILRPLPARPLSATKTLKVRVDSGSLIHVQGNAYSVASRLIGETVDVVQHADYLEVWYAQKKVETLDRLRGRGKHRINYRHVIDWLVRKPGAFENYRYREDLYPTSRFRMACDELEGRTSLYAKEYLKLLELAAKESESAVDDALRLLIEREQTITFEAVEAIVRRADEIPSATDVEVEEADLSAFDCLLDMEDDDEIHERDDCRAADVATEGIALADLSGAVRGIGPPGGGGDAQL